MSSHLHTACPTDIDPNRVAKTFGCVLRDERIAQDISQTELSERADVDRTFISLMERGSRQCSLTTLFKLARAFGIRPSTLVARMERLLR
jgi:transcriptional regulator with XRE-family HTH domain